MADIKIGADEATDIERSAVDSVVGPTDAAVVVESERFIRGGEHRRKGLRHLLLPALHALQNQAGWISPGGLNYIAERLQVPPAEGYGVATFYEMFRVDEPGHDQDVVHVCVDAACQISGSEETIDRLEAEGKHVHRSPCLGQCERPVAQFIQGRANPDRVEADNVWDDIDYPSNARAVSVPQAGDPSLRLLRRAGVVDPSSLSSYIAAGGYKALAKAFERGADGVLDEVVASGLTGRGGAAFPTGVKWRGVAAETAPEKHVVVNADESEPGTFKDRVLIENDPFSIVEAATIAGFATGASKGWVYIRGEYPLATERLETAIAEARDAGFLGESVARSSFAFDIEVRRGAGAYICGEETALFNSLEGFRGEPRQKPPFPTTSGLFQAPTAINNPETLANVLDIVVDGGAAFASIGTKESNGSKLFCLSGHVERPGVYEVDFGVTLRELLDLAGGIQGDLQAVLLGGAAGSFLGPESLDVELSFEATKEAGLSLGSGVVMPFNTEVAMAPVVQRIAEFFRNESCGQCVPCRVGTVRQHEVVSNLNGTKLAQSPQKLQLLDDIDVVMKDGSICGLGHTAGAALHSAIKLGLI